MRKLIAMLMLLPTLALAVNPTNFFRGYPWSANVTTTWNQVESTNNIIRQLMLQLKDRCDVVSRPDLGNYENHIALWAGVKTNYVYMEGSYTQHPNINLQMTNVILNTYSNFAYGYPEPNTFSSALVATGQPYVSREMLAFLNTGIIQVAYYYAAITNVDTYFSNGVIETPRYSMASLALAAGYTNNVSNLVYNAGGQIIHGDWNWQTELPSNGVMTLAALDERAAYIAQLKYVVFNGKPCSPYRIGDKKRNWPYSGERDEYNSDNTELYHAVNRMPFAWRQTSLDTSRVPLFFTMNSQYPNWTDAVGSFYQDYNPTWDGSVYVNNGFAITNLPSDWPRSGWYENISADRNLSISRDNTNHPLWTVTTTPTFQRDTGFQPDIFLETSNQLTMVDNTIGTVVFVSNWHTDNNLNVPVRSGIYSLKLASYWQDAHFDVYSDPYSPPHYTTVTNESWTTITTGTITSVIATNSTTNLVNVSSTIKSFDVWGDYLKFSGLTKYTNHISDMAVPPYDKPTTQIVERVFTNYTDLYQSTYKSNYFWIYSGNVATGEYVWVTTNKGPEQTSGSLLITNLTISADYCYRDSIRQEVYSFQPDVVTLYTNRGSTATVWAIGGDINLQSTWQNDTVYDQGHYVTDWTNYVWQFDTNAFGFNITTNAYTKLAGYNTLTSVDANGMLLYRDIYDHSAVNGQPYGYLVFDFTEHPSTARQFWGIRDCIFILEYAFTNRY